MKQESTALGGDDADAAEYGPTPIQPQEDAIEVAGVFFQDVSNRDNNVLAFRVGADLKFKDVTNPSGFTLAQLASGSGVSLVDYLLNNDPVAVDVTYVVTYTTNKVSNETWTDTGTSLALKTCDYTYNGNLADEVVTKVYDTDGTTVIGQTTETYSYSGNRVSGSVKTRDV
jgi:hypothetical protein